MEPEVILKIVGDLSGCGAMEGKGLSFACMYVVKIICDDFRPPYLPSGNYPVFLQKKSL